MYTFRTGGDGAGPALVLFTGRSLRTNVTDANRGNKMPLNISMHGYPILNIFDSRCRGARLALTGTALAFLYHGVRRQQQRNTTFTQLAILFPAPRALPPFVAESAAGATPSKLGDTLSFVARLRRQRRTAPPRAQRTTCECTRGSERGRLSSFRQAFAAVKIKT